MTVTHPGEQSKPAETNVKTPAMKILFISTTYPTPRKPRQGAFNFNMVNSLKVHHDVRVIAPVPWVEYFSFNGRSLQIDSSVCGSDWHPTYFYPPKLFRSNYGWCFWQSILPAIRQLEKSFVPDLVVGYWLHPDAAAARRVADRFGVPCVAFSGGSDLKRLTANPARKIEITKVLLKTDQLIVVSQDLAECAINLGMPAEKIDVVYRGVNQECFQKSDRQQARLICEVDQDAIVLMWSGRFEPVKNPLMLLRVAAKLVERWGDRLQVVVTGDGSMRRKMFDLRCALGLKKCVRFHGNLNQQELAVRYNAADLILLTSHSEGVPNVLLESMSCGTPFVATDVGGVSEIATAGMDHVVVPGDVDLFADAVIKTIESPGQVQRTFQPKGLTETALRLEKVFGRTLNSARQRIEICETLDD